MRSRRARRVGWLHAGFVVFAWLSLLVPGGLHASDAEGADAWATSDVRTHVLRSAEATIEVGGEVRRERVELPYHWERRHPGRRGRASFVVTFELDASPVDPWTLYIARLGNAFEVSVNGARIAGEGDLQASGGGNHGRTSRMLPIPAGVLQAGTNRVQVTLRADGVRFGGLSAMVVGSDGAVQGAHGAEHLFRTYLTPVVLQCALLVGLLAFALWCLPVQVDPAEPARRLRDPLYLYAWAGEAALVIRLLQLGLDTALPWWAWSGVGLAALGARCGFNMLFALQVSGRLAQHGPRRTLAVPFLWGGLGMVCGASAVAFERQGLATAFIAASALFVTAFTAWYAWQARRGASRAHLLLAVVLAINAMAGIWDWIAYFHGTRFALVSVTLLSTLLFGFALVLIVLQRYRNATRQASELMATLSARVAAREAELVDSFRRLEAIARDQARAAERERLVREMHDGVGAGLATAIRQIQARGPSDAAMADALRDVLDRLKLTVDALSVEPGDVVALLAGLRHRLASRLTAAGLELDWDVDEIAPLPGLDDRAMRTLQSMLLEAISNVLQHAQARRLSIRAGATADGVRVRIADDGRGFDPARIEPRSLHAHARALGARLALSSSPAGTTVEIELLAVPG